MSKALSPATEEIPPESAVFLYQALNSVWDPIYIKNEMLQFTFVNDAMCSLQGKKREDLLGKTLPEISHDEQTQSVWNLEKAVLQTGTEHMDEGEIVNAEGTMRAMVAKRSLITDSAGRKYVFCIMKDAAGEKPVAVQAKGSSPQKSENVITREIIHDLNNSLNVIRGYSELLLEDIATDDPMHKDLEAILQAGRHAADLASKF